ncbi:MAG: hypothetical protein U9R21_10270 [Candidatus Thermoplasmatota archaeon]|nr:hypothetical protein [Candidatus Thermoplasmatota archaeon]
MEKIVPFCLAVILLFSSSAFGIAKQDTNTIDKDEILDLQPVNPSMWIKDQMINTVEQSNVENPSLIDNYTWAVMRYDSKQYSENYGIVGLTTPSAGTILIPANMMSNEVCRAAISVYRDSKMETLEAFDAYVSERMLHTSSAFYNGEDEWHTETCYNFRKESAVEMGALGDICLRADIVGECYAQASFNTAVLRLCGFSAEEVFTVAIQSYQGGHGINVVKVEDQWYVLDSTYAPFVRIGMRDGIIFEKYFMPPITDYIILLENDKYMINFGTLYPQYIPTMKDPYLNMDSEKLSEIIEDIRPLFNNSFLGKQKWTLDSFVENATPNPCMKTIAVPYTVEDAEGLSIEEKATDLAERCRDFIFDQDDENNQDQYDKSCYALGLLSVDYPQVYANAAKLAAWTSWYGIKRDMSTPFFDVFMTSFWTRATILNKQVVPNGCVAYSDLLYLRHAGSSVDKAVLAYGTLRNMEKDNDFWSADDLYVLITDDNQGYLAVNLNDDWKYLNFEGGKAISDDSPGNVDMAFNEVEYLHSWEE